MMGVDGFGSGYCFGTAKAPAGNARGAQHRAAPIYAMRRRRATSLCPPRSTKLDPFKAYITERFGFGGARPGYRRVCC
jgi:hypothetical protein